MGRADLDGRELADARLLASELVTNALVHGHGTINTHAELDENHLLVEVIDEGTGSSGSFASRISSRAGGSGLYLVDVVATRWGIHEGSSHAWFELERRGPLDPPTTR